MPILMIHDADQLRSVVEEISDWTLDQRRDYIRSMGEAFGEPAAEQIRNGLKQLWSERDTR